MVSMNTGPNRDLNSIQSAIRNHFRDRYGLTGKATATSLGSRLYRVMEAVVNQAAALSVV